jgi:dihydrolipoamide dehydrogenase
LKEKGIKYKVGIAPTGIVGRANTSDQFNGLVKVLTDQKGYILGAAIVCPNAGEMIHELALAMKLHAKASDIAEMIHAYPTFSEAIKIACSSIE